MSKRIGVIGAGTAGLQLGLYLRRHGVEVTLFTDRRPEEYRTMRLLNTVTHHHLTIEREDALGCNHWPVDDYGYTRHYYSMGSAGEGTFYGTLPSPSRAVDYRIYQPRLLEDFIARGGVVEYGQIAHEDLPGIAASFDLLVVCTGKGPFGQMFRHEPEHSPFDRPQRALCVGLYTGVRDQESRGLTFHVAPGVGEMVEIPTLSFDGMVTALLIEGHIGGDLELLTKTKYESDPDGFMALLLEKLRQHFPDCAARIDEDTFGLANGALDILQGGLTPTVRNSYAVLENGKLAVALGDVHAVVDPILGQGANTASYAAWALGEAIVAEDAFDIRFIEKVDAVRQDRILCASRWTNAVLEGLRTLSTDLHQMLDTVSAHQALCDEFTGNFAYPERQWDYVSSPERMQNWLNKRLTVENALPVHTDTAVK